jgi:hypothetical protein
MFAALFGFGSPYHITNKAFQLVFTANTIAKFPLQNLWTYLRFHYQFLRASENAGQD